MKVTKIPIPTPPVEFHIVLTQAEAKLIADAWGIRNVEDLHIDTCGRLMISIANELRK